MTNDKTTVSLDNYLVTQIIGNRSKFIREAIAEKLLRDQPSKEALLKELKSLKTRSKQIKKHLEIIYV